jgi:hypothetical protein
MMRGGVMKAIVLGAVAALTAAGCASRGPEPQKAFGPVEKTYAVSAETIRTRLDRWLDANSLPRVAAGKVPGELDIRRNVPAPGEDKGWSDRYAVCQTRRGDPVEERTLVRVTSRSEGAAKTHVRVEAAFVQQRYLGSQGYFLAPCASTGSIENEIHFWLARP